MAQCKALGIDYEKENPKLNERQSQLFSIFSTLNRRRIDHRPLQEEHISKEISHLDYPDKSLYVIESVDSYWLEQQAKKIARKSRR